MLHDDGERSEADKKENMKKRGRGEERGVHEKLSSAPLAFSDIRFESGRA